jgi:uncharacterized protein (DUF1330 family)
MAKGYVIGRVVVTNATQYAQYVVKSTEAIKAYGGVPIVRGGRMEVAEGTGAARNVVIEFPSLDAARAFAYSPEYAAARKLREGAATADLIIVEGAS